MYYSWRITKFDPKFRDKYGRYIKNDWTSISDVNKVVNGQILSFESYLHVEDKYVQAVLDFSKYFSVPSLKIVGLEKYSETLKVSNERWYTEELKKVYSLIEEGLDVSNENIEYVCKLILRNDLWCKLEYEKRMFIHFGYDYYMYIVSDGYNEELLNKISDNGLFVEQMVSPYLEL